MDPKDKIFVALDGLGKEGSVSLVRAIAVSSYSGSVIGCKIHDLWDREGPTIVKQLKDADARQVWVDLKLHDTPATVALRAQAVLDAGADIVTVHTSGGIEMMMAANKTGLIVLGITVLTSLTEEDTHLLTGQPAKAAVLQRARMAKLAGLWGIVCSAHEVGVLAKTKELAELRRVVPGIRLKGKGSVDDNQKRVDSPSVALQAGADHIVLGSELTKSATPISILEEVVTQIISI